MEARFRARGREDDPPNPAADVGMAAPDEVATGGGGVESSMPVPTSPSEALMGHFEAGQ